MTEQKNRKKISVRMKLYYQENRKKINAKNKEKISVRMREKITCECGCELARHTHMSRHRRTKKHLNLMSNKQ